MRMYTRLTIVRGPVMARAGFVAKHKKTVEQFFEMCAKVSDAAPQVQAFIDILTASSEFTVFVVCMHSFIHSIARASSYATRSAL